MNSRDSSMRGRIERANREGESAFLDRAAGWQCPMSTSWCALAHVRMSGGQTPTSSDQTDAGLANGFILAGSSSRLSNGSREHSSAEPADIVVA